MAHAWAVFIGEGILEHEPLAIITEAGNHCKPYGSRASGSSEVMCYQGIGAKTRQK